jgi:hypothetical protein
MIEGSENDNGPVLWESALNNNDHSCSSLICLKVDFITHIYDCDSF